MSTSPPNHPFQFKIFPGLKSSRLYFTSLSENDAVNILALRTNQEVNKYIKRKPTTDLDAARAFIKYVNQGFDDKNIIFWAIRLSSNDALIGTISIWHFTDDKLEAEVGYELHPSYWGQGFAHEALSKILEFSFSILNLRKIEAFTHQDNKHSRLLLQKNNFILNPARKDDGNANNLIYELKSK